MLIAQLSHVVQLWHVKQLSRIAHSAHVHIDLVAGWTVRPMSQGSACLTAGAVSIPLEISLTLPLLPALSPAEIVLPVNIWHHTFTAHMANQIKRRNVSSLTSRNYVADFKRPKQYAKRQLEHYSKDKKDKKFYRKERSGKVLVAKENKAHGLTQIQRSPSQGHPHQATAKKKYIVKWKMTSKRSKKQVSGDPNENKRLAEKINSCTKLSASLQKLQGALKPPSDKFWLGMRAMKAMWQRQVLIQSWISQNFKP
ncbi:transcription factor [Dorcoceras hygrometricum]|uniref:Transcription factor n=1 Tax=Dorcoceras hygrometricum TaxID=472368 RepID=A0A2Z7A7N3_9LAMI|nr:transcription factor [Dorcoceras hygrometricum]